MMNDDIAIAIANYYDDLRSFDDFNDYMHDELIITHDELIIDYESLRDAIANDIHDLIHNANIDSMIPDSSMINDDEIESIEMRLTNDDSLIDAIARIIINRF